MYQNEGSRNQESWSGSRLGRIDERLGLGLGIGLGQLGTVYPRLLGRAPAACPLFSPCGP